MLTTESGSAGSSAIERNISWTLLTVVVLLFPPFFFDFPNMVPFDFLLLLDDDGGALVVVEVVVVLLLFEAALRFLGEPRLTMQAFHYTTKTEGCVLVLFAFQNRNESSILFRLAPFARLRTIKAPGIARLIRCRMCS